MGKHLLTSYYIHSSQNELPQHGIITVSVRRSWQIEQTNSSGIAGFSAISSGGRLGFLPSKYACLLKRNTDKYNKALKQEMKIHFIKYN